MREWDEELDFVAVGASAGALLAATVAAEAGLSTKVFEKTDRIGGGAAYSGAVLWVPDNAIMRRKGWPDSIDDALAYLEAASLGRADLDLARTYVETIGSVIAFIEDRTPLRFIAWPHLPDHFAYLPGAKLEGRQLIPHPGAAVEALLPLEATYPQLRDVRESPHLDLDVQLSRFTNGRPTREAWVGGRALIGGLLVAALDAGVSVVCNAPVAEILIEDARVVGIATEIEDRPWSVRARGGVLLNTGGYDWNAEMSRRSLTGGDTVRALTPPSLSGDGHVMAQRLGAATALMDQCMLNTGIHIPGETHDGAPLYRLFDPSLSKPHSIVVNRQGRRFANESSYYCVTQGLLEFDPRVRQYGNLPAFHISDRSFRERYGLPTVGSEDPLPDWIASADTLEDLADKLGIDAAGLRAQVEAFNASVDAGADASFQRGESPYDRVWGDASYDPNPTLGRIETGPFCAIEIFPASAGHRGGLVTSPAAEVLSVDDQPIPGLYACGNVAAQLMIGAAYASGISIGSALVFGRIAAQQIVRSVGAMTDATAG